MPMTRRLFFIAASTVTVLGTAVSLIPNLLPARAVSSRNACVTNLEQLKRLKQEWATKNLKSSDDTPTYKDLFGQAGVPTCPAGGTYTLGRVKDDPVCSFGPPEHCLPPRR